MVKNQVETDASGVKEAFKIALENHTSYNDQISAFLDTYKNNLSEETIKKIKNKYGSNEEYVKESIKKAEIKAVEDVLKKRETHVVKEECDETKQLLEGMTIIIGPGGLFIVKKSGNNTKQSTNKTFNDMSMSMNKIDNDIAVIIGDGENNDNVKKDETAKNAKAEEDVKAAEDVKAVEENVKDTAEKKVTELVNSTSSTSSNEDNVKAVEENVKDEAEKKLTELVNSTNSTSSNEDNVKAVEENVKDEAEKKLTEELVNVAAIKAVDKL